MSISESSAFQRGTFHDWYQQVGKELKGASPEQRIYWNPESGIVLPPFGVVESAPSFPIPRLTQEGGNKWNRGYALPSGLSAREENKLSLQLLQSGADALVYPHFGISSSPSAELEDRLAEICLPYIHNHFRHLGIADARMYGLMEVMGRKGFSVEELRGSFLCDAVFSALSEGSWNASALQDAEQFADFAERTKLSFPHLQPAYDGTLFHEAGATRIQELAWIMSSVHEQWLHLADSNAGHSELTLYVSVDHEILPQIAKFRALRFLWNELFSTYGSVPGLHIIAVPSNRSMTVYDANNNILRRTAAMYAAVTGGADTVLASAFMPKSWADHRVMLNLHHLLADESHLNYVQDPGDGSYSLDELALRQAEDAWDLFKDIENQGGIIPLIQNGKLQKQASEQAADLRQAFHQRKHILIGSNLYAKSSEDISEIPVSSFEAMPSEIGKLLSFRIAEELELFRKENEAQHSGFVFTLLKFGPCAMSTARANFISDFLTCGGYSWKEEEWDEQSDYSTSGQVLVLCSADEMYAEAMRSGLLRVEVPVYIAGNPENRDELSVAGVNGYIHARSPLFETLKSLKKLIK